ncbi:MAG TPA: hypothetical protein VEU73_01860 [Gemmatimonadales bacterium]|nr:hypothetical protein [Gemmatimonadales bacterium]
MRAFHRVLGVRGALESVVGAILRDLDGSVEPPDLPLDVRATAFQRRVWALAKEAAAP